MGAATESSKIAPPTAVVASCVFLAVAAALIFTRLGYYPFWGDEADTVIFARNVWETGDTAAWYGDNLYAYRDGTLLVGLKNRSTSPLQYYLAAPAWGLAGDDPFWMRLPFAACGWAAIALALWWAYRFGVSTTTFLLLGTAVCSNVSLILYARQCRYFGPSILLTVAIAYLYERYDGSRRRTIGLSACLCLSAATHYLNFAAVAAALAFDYVAWRRRIVRLSPGQWAALVVPTGLALAVLVAVYNPLGKNTPPADAPPTTWFDRARLSWWSIRDLNACEFGVGAFMALAPLVAWLRRDSALFRLFVACCVFTVVTVLASPQPIAGVKEAESDIRYLAPLIIPCTALSVGGIVLFAGRMRYLAVVLILVASTTNVLHLPWKPKAWRSTIGVYVRELREPRRTATAVLADWLQEHVRPGRTVWLAPNEWLAPQIVRAPHVTYAWQLERPRRPEDYANLPRIHFAGEIPVDFIVAMGFGDGEGHTPTHVRQRVLPILRDRGFEYEPAAVLDVFFDDRTRPELHWHWFRDQPYDKTKQAIYVFRRK